MDTQAAPAERKIIRRPNRKKRPVELQTVVTSVRLSKPRHIKLRALGPRWLEEQIDAAPEPVKLSKKQA